MSGLQRMCSDALIVSGTKELLVAVSHGIDGE